MPTTDELSTQIDELRQKAADPNPPKLPMRLCDDINKLCTQANIDRERANNNEQELQIIKENLDKMNLLVASVQLALGVENQSLARKLSDETRRIGATFNEMTFDQSKSSGEKLLICMKSVATTCMDTAIGLSQGVRQGFVANQGTSVLKGATTGAVLGSSGGFADSFMQERAKAEKKIADLRQKHGEEFLALYNKTEKNPADQARIGVLQEEGHYLSE